VTVRDRVLPLGDPRLRLVSAPVDLRDPGFADERARLHAVLAEFRRTHGFGRAIAAPQIGLARRFLAVDLGDGPFTRVDPRIVWRSDETFTLWDDCMCFPDLLVRVARASSISVTFTDEHGQPRAFDRLGRAAAELLQHEVDHLEGREAFARRPEWFRGQVEGPDEAARRAAEAGASTRSRRRIFPNPPGCRPRARRYNHPDTLLRRDGVGLDILDERGTPLERQVFTFKDLVRGAPRAPTSSASRGWG
jgi:peptide deformylase